MSLLAAPAPWVGGIVGGLVGLGIWVVVLRIAARRPRLDDRLAPYLRIRPDTSGLLRPAPVRSPFPTLERLVTPVMHDAVRMAERLGSPRADVQRRLARAGRPEDVDQFRAEQVVWAALGTAVGLGLALLTTVRGAHPVAGLALVAALMLAGLIGRDQLLSAQVRGREQRVLAELPTVAELIALAVGAGEGPLNALERVARTTRGDLADEIRRVVADAHAGTPVTLALERMADRTGVVALARFAEAVAVAIDRGTPLSDVLRAQAADVREASRTALMETGGRKEVLMMVPVVFLILPVTVVFAIFPGLAALRLEL